MNRPPRIERRHSVCPHDCPSTCALDVEVLDGRDHRPRARRAGQQLHGRRHLRQGRALCRAHPHPDRLLHPLRRTGPKGSGQFERISWDEALDLIAEAFLAAERALRPRGGVALLLCRHHGPRACATASTACATPSDIPAMYSTICTNLAWTGYIAGTGKLAGRRSARDGASPICVVIWGTNPVNTQVNVMTHAMRARKERGAKIVAVDIYHNGTMQQADLALLRAARHRRRARLRGHARAVPRRLCRLATISSNTPTARASSRRICATRDARNGRRAITGLSGRRDRGLRAGSSARRKRTYFRLGYGFAPLAQRRRQHACGARASRRSPAPGSTRAAARFHNNGAIYHWNKTLIEGLDVRRPERAHARPVAHRPRADRRCRRRCCDGPPVTAMLDPEHQSGVGRARAGAR